MEKKTKKVAVPEKADTIVNFTPDEQSKLLAIYQYLNNELKKESTEKFINVVGEELTKLFGAEVVGAASSLKLSFVPAPGTKESKREVQKAADELEKKREEVQRMYKRTDGKKLTKKQKSMIAHAGLKSFKKANPSRQKAGL